MADRIFLSNDSTVSAFSGTFPDEEVFGFSLANESSALTGSATLVPLAGGIAKANGKITDFWIGVVAPAVSASGFISANISATVNINSATCLSTNPAILGPASSAGAAVRKATNAGGGTSAVVNTASAAFSAGDMISINYNLQSSGSAAAGAAGTGFYAAVKVRYSAT